MKKPTPPCFIRLLQAWTGCSAFGLSGLRWTFCRSPGVHAESVRNGQQVSRITRSGFPAPAPSGKSRGRHHGPWRFAPPFPEAEILFLSIAVAGFDGPERCARAQPGLWFRAHRATLPGGWALLRDARRVRADSCLRWHRSTAGCQNAAVKCRSLRSCGQRRAQHEFQAATTAARGRGGRVPDSQEPSVSRLA
jgi:hypothetical protein